jgi:hypothetical protein
MQTANKMICLICFMFELLLVLSLRLKASGSWNSRTLDCNQKRQAKQVRAGWTLSELPHARTPVTWGFTDLNETQDVVRQARMIGFIEGLLIFSGNLFSAATLIDD